MNIRMNSGRRHSVVWALGAIAATVIACVSGDRVTIGGDDGTDGGQGQEAGTPGVFAEPPSVDSGNGACAALGCNKVDILFVVDNSLSMGSAQRALSEAFPTFFDRITTQLKDTDFHLMLVDTDASGYERTCASSCPTPDFDASDSTEASLVCRGFSCASINERGACDVTLGAGVTYPVGTNTSNRNCNFPAGRRYLTSKDENLAERFLCSAAVGTAGNGDERPIGAMLAALEVESQKGGCNEGFLRDDALLVVVIVSDAGSTASELDTASTAEWRNRLLALKCGREEGVVVTTISHDGSQIAPWYSKLSEPVTLVGWNDSLASQWNTYCMQVPENDECCCGNLPFRFPCPACTSPPPPWEQCWFAFTGYGAPLVRLADSFGERGTHRELCDDFSDVLDGTLETVKKACVLLK